MIIDILIIILGGFVLIKPDIMWKWENLFFAKHGAPTKAYMILLRLAGLVLIVYGLASMFHLG